MSTWPVEDWHKRVVSIGRNIPTPNRRLLFDWENAFFDESKMIAISVSGENNQHKQQKPPIQDHTPCAVRSSSSMPCESKWWESMIVDTNKDAPLCSLKERFLLSSSINPNEVTTHNDLLQKVPSSISILVPTINPDVYDLTNTNPDAITKPSVNTKPAPPPPLCNNTNSAPDEQTKPSVNNKTPAAPRPLCNNNNNKLSPPAQLQTKPSPPPALRRPTTTVNTRRLSSQAGDCAWFVMYDRLVKYKKEHGNCHLPRSYSEVDPELAKWVIQQRLFGPKGKLSESQRRHLDAIGFVWDERLRFWNDMFDRLLKYKQTHGDCSVPQRYDADRQLGKWVVRQREAHRQGKLNEIFRRRLMEIGFVWDAKTTFYSTMWNSSFERLLEYKKVYGNCNVPIRYKADQKLANWVHKQRHERKKGELKFEWEQRLTEIGFAWSLQTKEHSKLWSEKLSRLEEYKRVYGDCKVPSTFSEDPSLANWVVHQRAARKKGKLGHIRECLLTNMGFVWDCR